MVKFIVKNTYRKEKIFEIKKINENLLIKSSLFCSLVASINEYSQTKNDETVFNILINIVTDILISKSITANSIHKNFLLFSKILNFEKVSRKNKIDLILQKCKAKFFKTFHCALKKIIGHNYKNIRLPRRFIGDININSNKKFLDYKMGDIFGEYNIKLDEQNGINVENNKNKIILDILLNNTYKVLFHEYLDSKRYKNDCKLICSQQGKKYELLFRYVSKIYILYYSICSGNRISLKK